MENMQSGFKQYRYISILTVANGKSAVLMAFLQYRQSLKTTHADGAIIYAISTR